MKEILIDKEKAEKVKSYLLTNGLLCASKTLADYVDYTEKVFSVL